ncbi:MAG: hypothetical protein WBX14_14710 [Candidatus Udaeobacter sp.]
MSGGANDKLTSTDSTTAPRRRGFDWPHALVELATVIVGILIALAINNWAQARHNAALEAGYLDRLLSDSTENATMLQERINLHTQRAATLAHLTNWLTNGTQPPANDEVSSVLCLWFMQPALRLRRETYAELVSTGNLSLLRDVPLRAMLEQAETRREEALRLDRFLDTLQRVTEPLNQYRQWQIDPTSRFEVGCQFDLNGMRSDPAIPSILAQLYRDQTVNRSFREQELAAERAVHDRIIKLRSER